MGVGSGLRHFSMCLPLPLRLGLLFLLVCFGDLWIKSFVLLERQGTRKRARTRAWHILDKAAILPNDHYLATGAYPPLSSSAPECESILRHLVNYMGRKLNARRTFDLSILSDVALPLFQVASCVTVEVDAPNTKHPRRCSVSWGLPTPL